MEQEKISGILTGVAYRGNEPYIGIQLGSEHTTLISPSLADHLIESLIAHLVFIGYERDDEEIDREKLH